MRWCRETAAPNIALFSTLCRVEGLFLVAHEAQQVCYWKQSSNQQLFNTCLLKHYKRYWEWFLAEKSRATPKYAPGQRTRVFTIKFAWYHTGLHHNKLCLYQNRPIIFSLSTNFRIYFWLWNEMKWNKVFISRPYGQPTSKTIETTRVRAALLFYDGQTKYIGYYILIITIILVT